MLAKITDVCLYFLAVVVVLAVVVGFTSEIKNGPSASKQKKHYDSIAKPIIMTATEAAEKHLDEANEALEAESREVNSRPKVKSKPRIRRLFKRRIFLRWRRR